MILIFTDGSSRGNPGPGGWGVIVRFGEMVKELGGFEKNTTNNRMEMSAIINALKFINEKTEETISIYTDSKYTIDGITKWVFSWKNNGWKTKNKTEVLNKDLWEELYSLVNGKKIEWHHVAGHVGIPGNERVDVIANGFAGGEAVPLFDGYEKDYTISLSKLSPTHSKVKDKNGKAYSYLALVEGNIHRFATWNECESFVKGKHAKFRKTISKDHEQEVLKEWGVM